MHIHSYSKHITIADIRTCMHSYTELIQFLMPITNLCLFGSPVRVTELFLFRTYAYNRLMLIRISLRSYRAYSYSELMLITDLCLFGSPVGVIELILIQKYP